MLSLLFAFGTAHAADVDTFRPAGSISSGQGTIQGESPFLLAEGLSLGLFGSFAQDLAVIEYSDGSQDSLVQHVVPIEVYGGYTFGERLRLEVFLPIYAHVNAPIASFNGPALGDARLQANAAVVTGRDDLRLSLIPRLELPSGTRNAQVRRGLHIGVTAALAGEAGKFGWVTNAGVTVAPADEIEGVGLGSSVDLLAGAYWRVSEPFRIGAEADTAIGFVSRDQGSNTVATGHI